MAAPEIVQYRVRKVAERDGAASFVFRPRPEAELRPGVMRPAQVYVFGYDEADELTSMVEYSLAEGREWWTRTLAAGYEWDGTEERPVYDEITKGYRCDGCGRYTLRGWHHIAFGKGEADLGLCIVCGHTGELPAA